MQVHVQAATSFTSPPTMPRTPTHHHGIARKERSGVPSSAVLMLCACFIAFIPILTITSATRESTTPIQIVAGPPTSPPVVQTPSRAQRQPEKAVHVALVNCSPHTFWHVISSPSRSGCPAICTRPGALRGVARPNRGRSKNPWVVWYWDVFQTDSNHHATAAVQGLLSMAQPSAGVENEPPLNAANADNQAPPPRPARGIKHGEDTTARDVEALLSRAAAAQAPSLDLSACNLASLAEHRARLDQLRALRHLDVSRNQISSLRPIRGLPALETVKCSGNLLKVLDGLEDCPALAAITAADNMIAALADLRAHTKLRTLNLRGNALVSIAALPHHLPAALHTLDVANNDLGNLSDLRYASSLMELRRLDLRANPFTSMAHMQRIDYRPFVVCLCPALCTYSLVPPDACMRAYMLTPVHAGVSITSAFAPGHVCSDPPRVEVESRALLSWT